MPKFDPNDPRKPLYAQRPDLFAPVDPSLPDSGARTQFATGAVRENKAGKGRFADIPPCALRSLAKRFQDGEPAHGRGNWMKGLPLSSYQDSATRHILEAAQGHTDEDHFGAALWNIAAWQWTEQEIEAGRLPKSLDDLPFRRRILGTLEALTNDPSFPTP